VDLRRSRRLTALCAVVVAVGGSACSNDEHVLSSFGHGEARVQTRSGSFDLVTATATFDPQTREVDGSWSGDGRTFTVAGPARVGSYPTSNSFVVALDGGGGFSSRDGSCTVQVTRADSDGVAGDFDCRDGGISGSFTLSP